MACSPPSKTTTTEKSGRAVARRIRCIIVSVSDRQRLLLAPRAIPVFEQLRPVTLCPSPEPHGVPTTVASARAKAMISALAVGLASTARMKAWGSLAARRTVVGTPAAARRRP